MRKVKTEVTSSKYIVEDNKVEERNKWKNIVSEFPKLKRGQSFSYGRYESKKALATYRSMFIYLKTNNLEYKISIRKKSPKLSEVRVYKPM